MVSKTLHKTFVRSLFVLILVLFSMLYGSAQNSIVQENLLPGTPQSEWDAIDGGVIEGFAQEFSVNKGDSVHFKIDIASSSPQPYTVKIYRLGWYQGNGARFMADLGALSGAAQPQPNYDPVTGKTDCNNWAVSAAWKVPATAVSGVYIARLDCPSVGDGTTLVFVVRDDQANAPVLFKTSDATWQAYNPYGGNNFYGAAIPVPGYSHATKVSYQRPVHMRGDKSSFYNAEYPMIRWMERNGYNISYTTDMDISRDATPITPANHKVILSVGHDEYWSTEAFNKIENARNNGVHLAFFSGNEVYWKTRWEDNYQTLVCYKEGTMGESVCGGKCDPETNIWTGLWRDGCGSAYPANDGCRPEGTLTGQMSWTQSTGSVTIPSLYKNLRFWKNTSVASLADGQSASTPYGVLGNEWDPEHFTNTYPPHRTELSKTLQDGKTHKMAIYRHPSGAFVYSAGTMQWPWGLDDRHDLNTATGPVQPVSRDMQQATVNLLFDMEAIPASMQSDLIMPTAFTDNIAPTSVISSPANGAALSGNLITITGTSTDAGGAAVGGVEVSLDNGATWQRADGLENWSFTFTPSGYATLTVLVRAWDDMGNVETPGSVPSSNAITISLIGPFKYSVFNATYPISEPGRFTGNPVELGMKFRTSVSGKVTGFRYYKGPGVSGLHIGHLWSKNGTMLAEATFTDETATGWQTVMLSQPVSINVNETYTVSYFTASGDFVRHDPFFTQAVTNGFLRGLASGEDGGNGVYAYGSAPSFPADSYNSSNYYADVIFESDDNEAPYVTGTTPASSSTNNQLNISISTSFNETLDASTVSASTVHVRDANGNEVAGTIALTGGNKIVFTPADDLVQTTTYTVIFEGGSELPVIKDLIGNRLAADYQWQFSTGTLSVPLVSQDPSNVSACAFSTVSFSSNASAIPTPDVKWQKSHNGTGAWTDIPGATASTYSFQASPSDNGNLYRAMWTNSQGETPSAAALLTVAPEITGSLAAVDSNLCAGENTQLILANATGTGPYNLTINGQTYYGINIGEPFRPYTSEKSIWPSSAVPAEQIHVDNNAIEVGVKFTAANAGVVKGIRFYKGGAANGGTHQGSLWNEDGQLMASATFVNETNSGWQTVFFNSPVAINANTTYIASCFLPQGNYSKNGGYFANSSFSSGNGLTALQNADSNANGVYKYTATSGFPNENFDATNYWVDVVYATYAETTATQFNMNNMSSANGCTSRGNNNISSVTIQISSPADAGIISGSSRVCIGSVNNYLSSGTTGGTWSSNDPSVMNINSNSGEAIAVAAGRATVYYSVTGCNGTFTSSFAIEVQPNAFAGTVTGEEAICIGVQSAFTTTGEEGVWSSSDASVASVDQNGLVTGLTPGTVTITHTVTEGCNSPVSASAQLIVRPDASAGIVNGASPLCMGNTSTYTTTGNLGGDWSSSNPAVATVTPNGLVKALTPGTVNIIYTVTKGCNNPVSSYFTLTVNPNVVAGPVTGNSELCIGNAVQFNTAGDAGGSWSSNEPSIALVDASGMVTAISAGTATISYAIRSGCGAPATASRIVEVKPNANAGVISGISPICININTIYTSNGDIDGIWNSSNPAVASISSNGSVTGLSAGTTEISYTVSGCGGTFTATRNLVVNPDIINGSISGVSNICMNIPVQFTTTASANGTWSSSNTAVASINANGVVTGLSAGNTNIIYYVAGCNGIVSLTYPLTVLPNVTAGTITGNAQVCVNGSATYSSNGNTGGTWTSSNTSVATINGDGQLTAITAGTTVISYSVTGCGGTFTATKTITIAANANAGTISGNASICINATTVLSSNGTSGGTWSSSNTAIATVTSAGSVKGISAGNATINYTVNGCSGSETASFNVIVMPNVSAGVISGADQLCIRGTAVYTSNGNMGGTWSSSNTSVATINANGEVNAVSAGTTTISYMVNGCGGTFTATKTLTVSPNANAGTVSGSSNMCTSTTSTFTSNGDAGGIWSSSNTAVATVNANGLVTAVSAGTASITYQTSRGCNGPVSSSLTVTVSTSSSAGTITGSASVCAGSTISLSSNGTAGGTWLSSNTSIATVSASGVVTGVNPGNVTISYRVIGCGGTFTATKAISVTARANAGSISGNTPLCINTTSTYTSNGTTGGVWGSSNTAVATVSATGLVKGISAGTATISYTVTSACGTTTSTKVVTIKANANAGVISGTVPSCVLGIGQFTTTGDAGGTWWSTNPLVLFPLQNGQFLGLLSGNTTIVYTVNNGCNGSVSATLNVSFDMFPMAGTISGNANLCVGSTTTYSSNGSDNGYWSSNNSSVATVNSNGVVTGVRAGTATISYTVPSCFGNSISIKTITVSDAVNAGIINGVSSLCINGTSTYTTTGTSGGVWKSSKTTVATINASTGAVRAVAPGTTTISYTVSSTCSGTLTATKTLTVGYCYSRTTSGSANQQELVVDEATKAEVYPNPSSSSFTLALKDQVSDKITIIVTDLHGKKVYQASSNKNRVDFGKDFAPGIYLVQVIEGNNRQTIKIIKQ